MKASLHGRVGKFRAIQTGVPRCIHGEVVDFNVSQDWVCSLSVYWPVFSRAEALILLTTDSRSPFLVLMSNVQVGKSRESKYYCILGKGK